MTFSNSILVGMRIGFDWNDHDANKISVIICSIFTHTLFISLLVSHSSQVCAVHFLWAVIYVSVEEPSEAIQCNKVDYSCSSDGFSLINCDSFCSHIQQNFHQQKQNKKNAETNPKEDFIVLLWTKIIFHCFKRVTERHTH